MNVRTLLTAALLLIAALPLYAQSPADVAHKSIQAAYDRRNAALAKGDIEGYLAVCSPAYRNMDAGRTLDGQRQAVIRLLQHTQRMAVHETVQNVTMIGKDALVTLNGTEDVYEAGSKQNPGPHFHTHTTGRAFWLSTPQGWRLKQERTLTFPDH